MTRNVLLLRFYPVTRPCYQRCSSKRALRRYHRNNSYLQLDTSTDINYGESRMFQEISSGVDVKDALYKLYGDPTTGNVDAGKMIKDFELTGIRRTDPRLANFMENLKTRNMAGLVNIDEQHFKQMVEKNKMLLSQIYRNQLIVPDFSSFSKHIGEIFNRCKDNVRGNVATYIPQLARADPDHFALSICSVDGQRLSMGDTEQDFTFQSCCKPFTYAICLNELGPKKVHEYVGYEPSGKNFNEIVLDSYDKPHNPMLNGGALITCSLLLQLIEPGYTTAEKYDYIKGYLQRIAGNEEIGFNNAVYLSERLTADRNFAMAYFMKEYKCFPPGLNLGDCLDLYFQACSLEITTEVLAVMGATLANGGICPTTGEKVLSGTAVRNVLSLMYSCGMYNNSGKFAFKVGLPAKSGVSGGLLLVVPNVMSVAMWSPPLDSVGNSIRGHQFCNELVSLYNFHRFDNLRHSDVKLDPRRSLYMTKGGPVITLLYAAKEGDLMTLQRQWLLGVDMAQTNYDGRSALHIAAAEGCLDCVQFLLDICQVPSHQQDRWGQTPLSEAERFGHTAVAELLKNIE